MNRTIGMMLPLAAIAATLGGCAYDDYGSGGVSTGYGPGPSYGYDQGYDQGPAGYGYDGAYGGLGGWYDDFYYPGTGVYVIDRGGGRHRWNDRQREYWQNRAHQGGGRPGGYRQDGRPDGNRQAPDGARGADWRGEPNASRPQVNPYRGGQQYQGDRRRNGQGMPMRPADAGRGQAAAGGMTGTQQSRVHPTPGPGPNGRGGPRGGAPRGGDGGRHGENRPAPQQ